MTKVKICGITNLEDALLSAKFGADALGFNFYKKSPRYITPEEAAEITGQLPKEVLKVGVFVNENLDKIAEIAKLAKLDALQLHGEETPEFAKELKAKTNLEIIKAFRVSPEFKPEDVLRYKVDAILLDAYSPKEPGGTGETFDWKIAKKVQEIFPKMYLAGGLSHDNIAKAIWEVRPFAVDACSCLESEKGKKDKPNTINFLCNVSFSNMNFENIKRKIKEPENLLSELRLYRYRPSFYLPEKSITQLCIFIVGFLSALNITKFNCEEDIEFFREFEKYQGIKRSRFLYGFYSYANHFLKQSGDNEERAFDLFYANLEEFKLEKENFGKDRGMLKSTIMTTTLEAIYENGIFKPVTNVPPTLREFERVKIIIETEPEIKSQNVRVSPEILREMLAEGLISHIPEGITDEEDDFEPIEIEGKSLSETLLEDRD